MPVLDSEYFPAGGGSVIKPYVSGMSVKVTDTVRSAKNFLPFIRKKSTPTSLVITSDPADLKDDFIVDDPTTSIGTIQSFQDSISNANSYLNKNGQLWLKTGIYVPASSYPDAPVTSKTWYDYWLGINTVAELGMASSNIVDMAGDGLGNWMAVNASGNIYKSIDDGASWTAIALTTTASAKLTCNGKGRWWIANNTGQVYVSENFGSSWTLQGTPGSAAPMFFKFMDGRLWWMPNTTYTISGSSGQLSFVVSVADTGAAISSWTGHFYNLSQALPYFSSGTTANIQLACSNNKGTVWFVGITNGNYCCIFVLNTVTGTWTVNSVGAAVYLQGISYDETMDCAWFSWGYGSNFYETMLTTTAAQTTTANPFFQAGTYSTASVTSFGSYSVYARKAGSSFFYHTAGQQNRFRYCGSSAVGVSRQPAVNGAFGTYYANGNLCGMAHAGDTSIVFWKSHYKNKSRSRYSYWYHRWRWYV